MKKIFVVFMILTLLVGCTSVAYHTEGDVLVDSKIQEEKEVFENNTQIYDDENHKKIQYNELSLVFDLYHIVSHTNQDSMESYKIKIDEGKVRPETEMTIKISTINRENIEGIESIIAYLEGVFPEYNEIVIYDNVIDDSGIISLFSITKDETTYYIVYYSDSAFKIESDYNKLSILLFQNYQTSTYKCTNNEIECADSIITNVKETLFYSQNTVEYKILQGKDYSKYIGYLIQDEESRYNFKLNNEKGENLLMLATYASDYRDVIEILDANMDGYADIRFLETSGTLNNSYELYVWDVNDKTYIKVKCDEILSEFEIRDDYIVNWVKSDSNSGIAQRLVFEGNKLIKESEEIYLID